MTPKDLIGYAVLAFAMFYAAGVTVALLLGCDVGGTAKEIVLVVIGWAMAKGSTVVDFFYGSSQSSQNKDAWIVKTSIEKKDCCHRHNGETKPTGEAKG